MIFLDIDGVLAPIRRWDRYEDLDPACVQVLNEIVAGCSADVVVSSTWRYGKSVAELQAMLDAKGFAGRVLDKTPTGPPGADRGEEIAAWLAAHDVVGYVIIDDHGLRLGSDDDRRPRRCRRADADTDAQVTGGRG